MSERVSSVLAPRPLPIERLLRPLSEIAHHKLAGAALLMLAMAVALVWANSPWRESYEHLLHIPIAVSIGGATLNHSLHHWINDGVMGIFFFYVGLEIKREILVGELSTLRKATLPAVAAVGGMVLPAGIYVALNSGGPGAGGWGIPMATDIAFALGVLALLGDRVPLGLKVFLTALAIVDDIGAVVVIAVFYTGSVAMSWLALGLAFIGISILLNRLGARNPVLYFLIGTVAWFGFLESGVHATIAAILMAFTIPARTRIDGADFRERVQFLLARLKALGSPDDTEMNSNAQQALYERMNAIIDHASAPLQRIETSLHGPVTFVVLPLFALANAGVSFDGGVGSRIADPIALGIIAGLVLGKVVGVSIAALAAVKLRIADLPANVTWSQLMASGLLAGIGFTMSLFVGGLAFSNPAQVETAKIGVLAASTIAGVIGFVWLRLATRKHAA
jgi:Na+:H+ antiporter, NhaA family